MPSREVVNVVREELENGISRERIYNVLAGLGYGEDEIQEVLRLAEKDQIKLPKYFILLAFVVAVILLGLLLLAEKPPSNMQNNQNINRCLKDNDCLITCSQGEALCDSSGECYCPSSNIEFGDPGHLSYFIPNQADPTQNVTNRTILGAKCTSDGKVICKEPAIDTFFLTKPSRKIADFRQLLYMKLSNEEMENIVIDSVIIASTTSCSYIGQKSVNIQPGGQSKEIKFFCVNPADPLKFGADVTVSYIANGQQKLSNIHVSA